MVEVLAAEENCQEKTYAFGSTRTGDSPLLWIKCISWVELINSLQIKENKYG